MNSTRVPLSIHKLFSSSSMIFAESAFASPKSCNIKRFRTKKVNKRRASVRWVHKPLLIHFPLGCTFSSHYASVTRFQASPGRSRHRRRLPVLPCECCHPNPPMQCSSIYEPDENKYRGDKSDATTPSSFIVRAMPWLRCRLMIFYLKKRPHSSFENNTGRTDVRTNGRKWPIIEMGSCI